MDSDKNNEELPVSSHVAMYLKYSKNKNLTKYFRGTHATYLPEIQVDQGEPPEDGDEKLGSPTSSLASNKKLEWDNGADIGYDNCSKSLLHKSTSLPSLSKKKQEGSLDKSKSTEKITVASRSSSSSISEALIEQLISFTQNQSPSSSEGENYKEKPAVSSATSLKSLEIPENPKSVEDKNISYIMKRIGLPGAESTPSCPESTNSDKKTDQSSTPKRQIPKPIIKAVTLCATKAVSLECLDNRNVGCSKKVQVSVKLEQEDKFVQTENVWAPPPKVAAAATNQSIVFINCSNGTEKNVQTDSDVACNSFEFLPGNGVKDVEEAKAVEKGSSHVKSSDNSSSLPKSSDDYSPAFVFSAQQSSSKSSDDSKYPESNSARKAPEPAKSSDTDSSKPLAELIALNQAKTLKEDVNIHFEVLQRLIRSKRYDKETKKRYIKKIVQKILDSTYVNDSTTSSEAPKRSKSDVTVSSGTDNNKQQKLQENIPWYPAPLKNLTIKTFSDEIIPEKKENVSQRSRFTISKSQFINSSSSRDNSSDNWKMDKTKSEKVWEQKKHIGQGDHLVSFAKNERRHQLNWIKNEISHLSKLKHLLEKPNNRIGGRTTTVYMLQNINSQNVPSCSKYVVETEIESNGNSASSNPEAMQFRLVTPDGESDYIVKEDGAKGVSSNIRGNIEISSDDKSTRIKVRANKEQDLKIFGKSSCNQEIQTCPLFREVISRSTQVTPSTPSLESVREEIKVHQPVQTEEEPLSRDTRKEIEKKDIGSQSDQATFTKDQGTEVTKDKNFEKEEQVQTIMTVCHCNEMDKCKFCCNLNKRDNEKVTNLEGDDKRGNEKVTWTTWKSAAFAKSSSQSPCCSCSEEGSEKLSKINPCFCLCHKDKTSADEVESKLRRNYNTSPDLKSPNSARKIHQEQILSDSEGRTKSANLKKYPTSKMEANFKEYQKERKQKENSIKTAYREAMRNRYYEDLNLPLELDPVKMKKLKKNENEAKKHSGIKKGSGDHRKIVIDHCICEKLMTMYDKSNSKIKKKHHPISSDEPEDVERITDYQGTTETETKDKSDDDGKKTTSKETEDTTTTLTTTALETSKGEEDEVTKTEESDDSSVQLCNCCKKSSTTFKVIQQKLNHEAIQLCRPCYKASKRFGLGCHHIDDYYYTVVDTRKLNDIRKTVHNLNKMKRNYCTCKGKRDYCDHCKSKLAKTTRSKNGIAYSVGFETDLCSRVRKRKKKHPLEQIKLLVPQKKENAEQRRRHLLKKEDIDKLREDQKAALLKNNRFFTEKEMKEVNRRICKNLPEIQERVLEHKQNLVKEANRLSAQIFNNKLRTAVLKGKVNIPMMRSVVEL